MSEVRVAEPRVIKVSTQCKDCLCGIRWEPVPGAFVHWLNDEIFCPPAGRRNR
jgi:hypothetical protein